MRYMYSLSLVVAHVDVFDWMRKCSGCCTWLRCSLLQNDILVQMFRDALYESLTLQPLSAK